MPHRDIDSLAQHLLHEGHADNEADARLAAARLILAAEWMAPASPPVTVEDESPPEAG
jgi:hypothetical protein